MAAIYSPAVTSIYFSPSCDVRAIRRSKTFLTDIAYQAPPRGVVMPRAFKASATARKLVAPAFCASRMIGRMFAACWSALALIEATALSRALESLGLPRVTPARFGRCKGLTGPGGD